MVPLRNRPILPGRKAPSLALGEVRTWPRDGAAHPNLR